MWVLSMSTLLPAPLATPTTAATQDLAQVAEWADWRILGIGQRLGWAVTLATGSTFARTPDVAAPLTFRPVVDPSLERKGYGDDCYIKGWWVGRLRFFQLSFEVIGEIQPLLFFCQGGERIPDAILFYASTCKKINV